MVGLLVSGGAVGGEIGCRVAVGSVAGSGGAVDKEISGRGAVGSVADGEAAIDVAECIAYDGGAVGEVNYSRRAIGAYVYYEYSEIIERPTVIV